MGMVTKFRSRPTILSASVLALYYLVTIIFIISTLCTRVNSNAWDSPAELIALAQHLNPPRNHEHTGAGINSTAIFQEKVAIVENRAEQLEFVFTEDGNMNDGSHNGVVFDKAY